MRMVVVLPAPLGPRKPKISPRPMVKLIPLTAVNSPNFLVRLEASTAYSFISTSRNTHHASR